VVRIAACSTAGLPGVWVIHAKFIADKSKFFYDCQPFLAQKINDSAQGFQKTWGISDTIGHQDNHGKFIGQATTQVLSPVS